MKDNFYAVIMAGGGGTRLWPLSTRQRPKQLLAFSDKKSLFAHAVERLKGLIKQENIFIVTIADHVAALREQAPDLSAEQYIIEPQPKGTASVVGLAAIKLLEKNPDAVMAVLTADHVIGNIPLFHDLLESAFKYSGNDYLVTLWIKPGYAATGYGYILVGEKLSTDGPYIVKKFVEKPNQNNADKYLEAGNYYWNSGMFVWRADRIMREFNSQMPDLFSKLNEISEIYESPNYETKFQSIWDSIIPETIDYGIMEHAYNILMLEALDLKWNDIGSWDSLYDFLPSDSKGNVIKNNQSVLIDSERVLIIGENKNKIIVSLGVDDLVVVDTEKALIVCKKGETQKIKQVIQELKNRDLENYL